MNVSWCRMNWLVFLQVLQSKKVTVVVLKYCNCMELSNGLKKQGGEKKLVPEIL